VTVNATALEFDAVAVPFVREVESLVEVLSDLFGGGLAFLCDSACLRAMLIVAMAASGPRV